MQIQTQIHIQNHESPRWPFFFSFSFFFWTREGEAEGGGGEHGFTKYFAIVPIMQVAKMGSRHKQPFNFSKNSILLLHYLFIFLSEGAINLVMTPKLPL